MFQLRITKTSKSFGKSADFTTFDNEILTFPDKESVKTFLKARYGNHKRQKMFRDTQTGSEQVGYIYCFINDDISHVPVEKWLQQDWVEFQEVNAINPKSLRI